MVSENMIETLGWIVFSSYVFAKITHVSYEVIKVNLKGKLCIKR